MKKYNYVYKITNNINGYVYIGKHSTDNIDDGYMGSGSKLLVEYQSVGIDNFSKEIIKYFDTENEALAYEKSIVTEEFVSRTDTYNCEVGGKDTRKRNNLRGLSGDERRDFLIGIHKSKYVRKCVR